MQHAWRTILRSESKDQIGRLKIFRLMIDESDLYADFSRSPLCCCSEKAKGSKTYRGANENVERRKKKHAKAHFRFRSSIPQMKYENE
jgi:hypothetical protein